VFAQTILQAGIVGKLLQSLVPDGLRLVQRVILEIRIAERNENSQMIALFRLGLLNRIRFFEIGQSIRRMPENLRPVEIAVAARIEPDPGLLQFKRFREVSQRSVRQYHLRDRARRRNLIHIGEPIVQERVRRFWMIFRKLLEECDLAVEVGGPAFMRLSFDDRLERKRALQRRHAILAGIAQAIRVGLERLLEVPQRGIVLLRRKRLLALVVIIVSRGRSQRTGGDQTNGEQHSIRTAHHFVFFPVPSTIRLSLSAVTLSNSSFAPVGHRTSILSTFATLPSPKCTRFVDCPAKLLPPLMKARRVDPPAVSRTCAPTAALLDFVP